MATIQSFIGLMRTFAGFGIGMTATKYVAELKGMTRRAPDVLSAFSLPGFLDYWRPNGLVLFPGGPVAGSQDYQSNGYIS